MPIFTSSSYLPPLPFKSGHFNTLFSSLFRRVPVLPLERERIDTEDGDFLDLDWLFGNSDRLVILSHGLEGNSTRPYMLGMADAIRSAGWDVLAWNFRGCSGEPNRTPRLYHSGSTEDLQRVISHALELGRWKEVALVGFSLGGNLVLKYLGEMGAQLHSAVRGAVCFSVSSELESSVEELAKPQNKVFMKVFLKSLRQKIAEKVERFPNVLSFESFDQVRSFREFDELFTAPLHGFQSAKEYWERCSVKQYLSKISVPTLLVNALDDPMLGPGSFPVEEAQQSKHFFLEMPHWGGHVGFASTGKMFWSELRAAEFLKGVFGRGE